VLPLCTAQPQAQLLTELPVLLMLIALLELQTRPATLQFQEEVSVLTAMLPLLVEVQTPTVELAPTPQLQVEQPSSAQSPAQHLTSVMQLVFQPQRPATHWLMVVNICAQPVQLPS
jgi:hypothetical protein